MTSREIGNWVRACSTASVGPGESTTVDVEPPVAVWNVDGEYLATDDTCTHEKYSLSEGYVDGCQVECVLHWARFDLRTGEATLPATRRLATYPVRVADGEVFVDLSARDRP